MPPKTGPGDGPSTPSALFHFTFFSLSPPTGLGYQHRNRAAPRVAATSAELAPTGCNQALDEWCPDWRKGGQACLDCVDTAKNLDHLEPNCTKAKAEARCGTPTPPPGPPAPGPASYPFLPFPPAKHRVVAVSLPRPLMPSSARHRVHPTRGMPYYCSTDDQDVSSFWVQWRHAFHSLVGG